jgi:hypothetical protein
MAEENYFELREFATPAAATGLASRIPTGQKGSPISAQRQISGLYGNVARAGDYIASPIAGLLQGFTGAKAAQAEAANRQMIMQEYRNEQQKKRATDLTTQAFDIYKLTGDPNDFKAVVSQGADNPYLQGIQGLNIMRGDASYMEIADTEGNEYKINRQDYDDGRRMNLSAPDIIEKYGILVKAKDKKAAADSASARTTRRKNAASAVEDMIFQEFLPELKARLVREKRSFDSFIDPTTQQIKKDLVFAELDAQQKRVMRKAKALSDNYIDQMGFNQAAQQAVRDAYPLVYKTALPEAPLVTPVDEEPGQPKRTPAGLAIGGYLNQ